MRDWTLVVLKGKYEKMGKEKLFCVCLKVFIFALSSKPKRNGIVTNPALRLMSNVKNGLECAAERIQKTRQEVTRFNHSKFNSATAKSNGYHWKKETPL